ncbi:uncharacterized protein LAESUDRAFT_764542 [Laetiporus sulphureus 93-53]|uniref:Uncharacterized protein n=1 Tax=Laetiporus sulphureus 93-53 TaxID=1314785 RepID=A0A165B9B1_9APHY|nr:uncharacterized protein LAESUDRAFT_764542 [Laetiporus sulphureus 93-53]KZT00543.1 hypothetical protein LAESUDRAFT_764542 [Laetiporus sulphureus 93-53]
MFRRLTRWNYCGPTVQWNTSSEVNSDAESEGIGQLLYPDEPQEMSAAEETIEEDLKQGQRSAEKMLRRQREEIRQLRAEIVKRDQLLDQRALDGGKQEFELEYARRLLLDAQSSVRRLKKTIVQLKRENNALTQEKEAAFALLRARTDELRAAGAYHTKADIASDADVLRMVEQLNAEIFYISSQIADICRSTEYPIDSNIVIDGAVYELIGVSLVGALKQYAGQPEARCLLVQVALQTCMTQHTEQLIHDWAVSPGVGVDSEVLLDGIYNKMSLAESQPVSGRWQSLTKRHLKASLSDAIDAATRRLARLVSDTVRIVGALDNSIETIDGKYGSTLRGITSQALPIQKTVVEEITSSAFVPGVPRLGGKVDLEQMEDEYAEDGSTTEGDAPCVLCTTALGLWRLERHADDSAAGGHQLIKVVLKPKVVSDRLLQELRGLANLD